MLVPTVLRIASQPVTRGARSDRAAEVSRSRTTGDATGQEQQNASLARVFSHVGTPHGRAAVLSLGSHARHLARDSSAPESGEAESEARDAARPESARPPAGAPAPPKEEAASLDPNELSEGDQQVVDELEKRDREVRAHEQAHKAAGGAYAGAIHYDYQVGPDGKRYAAGGSVPIDVSPVQGDPEATLRKMEVVRRAALAPVEPSGADQQVAARASQQAQRARAEMAVKRYERARGLAPERGPTSASTPEQTEEPAGASHPSHDAQQSNSSAARRRVASTPGPARTLGMNVLRYDQSRAAAPQADTRRPALFSHVS